MSSEPALPPPALHVVDGYAFGIVTGNARSVARLSGAHGRWNLASPAVICLRWIAGSNV